MAVYTIAYKAKCTGGNHYTFNIKRGTTILRELTISHQDLKTTEIDVEEMATMLIKIALKTANPTTMAEARTAIEKISLTI